MKQCIQELAQLSKIQLEKQMMDKVKGGEGKPKVSKSRPLTGFY